MNDYTDENAISAFALGQIRLDLCPYHKIFRTMSVVSKGIILDMECGLGELARYLSSRSPGASIYGVDQDYKKIIKARQISSEFPIEYLVSGFELSCFKDRFFDQVFFRNAYGILYSEETIISTVFEKLKPGGEFKIIEVPSMLFDVEFDCEAFNCDLARLKRELGNNNYSTLWIAKALSSSSFEKVGISKLPCKISGQDFKLRRQRFFKVIYDNLNVFDKILKHRTQPFLREYSKALTDEDAIISFDKYLIYGKRPE